MKLIYLLTVFFYLPDGSFKDGNQVDGWSPRAFSTLEECEKRRDFVMTQRWPEWAKGWSWGCKAAPENWSVK